MAIASARAIPINMAGRILPEASGFLPIASIALKPIKPIAIAGPNPPIAIAAPLAKIISNFCSPLSLGYWVARFLGD